MPDMFGSADKRFAQCLCRFAEGLCRKGCKMANRNWYLSTSALNGVMGGVMGGVMTGILAVGFGTAVSAADLSPIASVPDAPPAAGLPAVSGINGKFSGFGGQEEYGFGPDGGFFGVDGSLSLPLGQRYGFQLDGMLASLNGNFIGGAASHLFWRKPETGLLGIYSSWVTRSYSSVDTWRIGMEGEYYAGRFSIEAVVGYENPHRWNTAILPIAESQVFAIADLAYYATPDLRFSVGYQRLHDIDMATIGTEWQLPTSFIGGTSLFAEGRIGKDDFVSVWTGLRVYLGAENKTLIRRHREDDPRNWLANDVFDFDKCSIASDFVAEDSIAEGCTPLREPG